MAVVILKERCKGCGYCIAVCPKKALTQTQNLNKQGYNYVEVDEETCVECGMCYTMCPESVFEIYGEEAPVCQK